MFHKRRGKEAIDLVNGTRRLSPFNRGRSVYLKVLSIQGFAEHCSTAATVLSRFSYSFSVPAGGSN